MASEKLHSVTTLVDTLARDLASPAYASAAARDAALDQLKILGRDPTHADPIFTRHGIATLARHAFRPEAPPSTARHALRVLANALLLVPATRRLLVDGGHQKDLLRVMRGLDTGPPPHAWDDEFLGTRVLFLMTYVPDFDLKPLVDDGLADVVCANLQLHADLAAVPQDPLEDMALAESAKLVFNATANNPELAGAFTPAVKPLVQLLWRAEPPPKTPLAPPLSLVINALMNLDLSLPAAQDALFPPADDTRVASRLVSILTLALAAHADADLETQAAPLASVVRHVHSVAPPAPKAYLRSALLPSHDDRKTVLGRGETLPSRLLHTSANPMTPALRETLSHLFFELSDRDPQRLVDNIGYGYASGFLFQNGMAPPQSATAAPATHDSPARPVNPITGQFADLETLPDVPAMTDTEKEREAERLFVLFQRLRENGVISVEDPMRTALEQGRFEELPDDADVD